MTELRRLDGILIAKGDCSLRELVERHSDDLADACLRGADLTGAYLEGADLTDACLEGANLWRADLRRANLEAADLRGADLTGVDLQGANLTGASLAGASLHKAYLDGANLTDADLADADLTDVCMECAILRGAVGLPAAPVIPDIDSAILEATETPGNTLDMGEWHTCATTHCRAGWAIKLAGKAGRELETRLGPNPAAALIYAASGSHPVPDWHASEEEAMTDLRARAGRGGQEKSDSKD